MNLPDRQSAFVPRRKVEDYLLNLDHPIDGGNAKFFIHFGFLRERWEELAAGLLRHAQKNPVTETVINADGTTYVIEGEPITLSGRLLQVRTIWLVETGELAPRFIAAYPLLE